MLSSKPWWRKFKILFSSQRLALAALHVNSSNIISTTAYAGFLVIQACFMVYVIGVIAKAQFDNGEISETWALEKYLSRYPEEDMLTVQLIILSVQGTAVGLFLYICKVKTCLEHCNASSFIGSLVSILFTALHTMLALPLMIIIFEAFFQDSYGREPSYFFSLEVINVINFFLMLWIQTVMRRLIILKVPCEKIPNTVLEHKFSYFFLMLKVSIVFMRILLSKYEYLQSYINLMALTLFFVTLMISLMKIVAVPFHNKLVNRVVNYSMWALLGSTFLLLANSFDSNAEGYMNLYYLLIVIPGFLALSSLVKHHWHHKLKSQMHQQHSKMELQFKAEIWMLMRCLEKIKDGGKEKKQNVQFLFGLIADHNVECVNASCICHMSEAILWILNQREDSNQQVILMSNQQVEFLNTVMHDPLFILDFYADAPYTSNQHTEKQYVTIRCKTDKLFNSKQQFGMDERTSIEFLSDDNTTADPNSDAHQNRIAIKVDPLRLKLAFFSHFIKIYFQRAVDKFPNNIDFKLLYAYYTVHSMHQPFLCINILKDCEMHKMSWIDKLSFQHAKFYLISLVQDLTQHQEKYEMGYDIQRMGIRDDLMQSRSLKNNIEGSQYLSDPQKYIDYDNLLESFDSTSLQLIQKVLKFWCKLEASDLDVNQMINESFSLADLIKDIYNDFKKLENFGLQHNDIIYLKFALINREILHDKSCYELYLQKYRQSLSMRKMMKNNFQITSQDSELGLLMVNGLSGQIGKILECNKQLREMSGYTLDDMNYETYEIFMNRLVKSWHPRLIQTFLKSGRSKKINKQSIFSFLLRKDGYIMPIKVFIRSFYSEKYGHAFIGFFTPQKSIVLDKQKIEVPVNQLIILLCDNISGRIHDVCQNARNMLQLKKKYFSSDQTFFDQFLRINDIVPQLDLAAIAYQKSRQPSFHDSNQFQGEGRINLYQIEALLKPFQAETQIQRAKYVDVVYTLFTEHYQEYLDLNIVILQVRQMNALHDERNLRNNQEIVDQDDSQDMIIDQMDHEYTASSASMSGTESSNLSQMIKSQQISMRNKIPKALKIVMQLCILMFLTIIVVSIVNLVLSELKEKEQLRYIEIVQSSFEKIYYGSRSRLVVRLLVDMANGYERKTSDIIPNKEEFFRQQLNFSKNGLLITQQYLDRVSFPYDDEFEALIQGDSSRIEYIDDEGRVYIQNHTLSFLTNNYVQRLLQIDNMNLSQLVGRTQFQTLAPAKVPFKITENERTIMWVCLNGNNDMRYSNAIRAKKYQEQIKEIALENIEFSQLTMIISISTITLVFLIVTPMLSMIQDRQYLMIKFFTGLDQKRVIAVKDQVQLYLNDIIAEQNDSQVGNKAEGQDLNPSMNGRKKITKGASQSFVSDMSLISSSNVTLKDHSDLTHDQNISMHKTPLATLSVSKFRNTNKFHMKSADESAQNNIQQESIKTSQLDESSVKINDVQVNMHHKVLARERRKQIEIDKEAEKEAIDERYANIRRQQVRKRWKVVIINLFAMLLLSVYFMVSFIVSWQLYSQVDYIVQSLNTIYMKDVCTENVIIYIRTNAITNSSFLKREDGSVASTKFLEDCLDYENLYTEMRKKKHQAFNQVWNTVDQMESNGACNITYGGGTQSANECLTMYKGIIQKGLSNAQSIILSYFHKQDISFQENQNRTKSDIESIIQDKDAQAMIEFYLYKMIGMFELLQNKFTQSAIDYFQYMTQIYLILFGVFITIIIFLIIVVFCFVFQNLKAFMWKITITLKLLPIDDFTFKEIDELKKFIKE